MVKLPLKRGKHNHATNLGIVLQEMRDGTPAGGVTLQHLVTVCGVSKRHVYRYLKELEEMGMPLERPQALQPGRSGAGRYKLTLDQDREKMVEMILLAIFNQMLEHCYLYQGHAMFIVEVILRHLAMRYGFYLFQIPIGQLFSKSVE